MREQSDVARESKRLARREAIAVVATAVFLLGTIGWLAVRGTAWSPRTTLRGDGDTWPLAFTPDATGFATAGTTGITLWDTATGRTRAFWAQSDGSHSGMAAFAPDGRTFAAIDFFGPGSPMAITLREASDGHVRWTLPIRNEGAYAILFTRAGKQVRRRRSQELELRRSRGCRCGFGPRGLTAEFQLGQSNWRESRSRRMDGSWLFCLVRR